MKHHPIGKSFGMILLLPNIGVPIDSRRNESDDLEKDYHRINVDNKKIVGLRYMMYALNTER